MGDSVLRRFLFNCVALCALVPTLVGGCADEQSLGEMAEAVFRRLEACNCHTVLVTQRGTLVGIVTMQNVGEFLRIQSAISHPPSVA